MKVEIYRILLQSRWQIGCNNLKTFVESGVGIEHRIFFVSGGSWADWQRDIRVRRHLEGNRQDFQTYHVCTEVKNYIKISQDLND